MYSIARYTTPRRALFMSAAKTAYRTAASSPFLRRAAASTIARAYRSYRRYRYSSSRKKSTRKRQPARARVGLPVGSDTSKYRQTGQREIDIGDPLLDRTLYAFDLTGIPQGELPTNRERDLINLRGFKVCMEVANTAPAPLYFNFAIISPKTDVNLNPIEFFRSYSDNRGTDFESPNISSLDYHCRPINTDVFNILHHKRYVLTTDINTQKGEVFQGNASVRIMRYFPVKRQVRYRRQLEGPGDFCTTPIFFVFWAAIAGYGTEKPPEFAFRTDARIITYFREPKH